MPTDTVNADGSSCYHCGDPVAEGTRFTLVIHDVERAMCCAGCQAVAQMIVDAGQADYYRYRTTNASRPDEAILDDATQWKAFDNIAEDNSTENDAFADAFAQAQVLVEGIHCGACCWLIEKTLARRQGVLTAQVDPNDRVLFVRWNQDKVRLSEILTDLVRVGYRPHPIDADSIENLHRQETDDLLRRLGVAGLGMMQVGMFAIAGWFGLVQGIDPAIDRLLVLVSMIVATPVVFYAGRPFLVGAIRSLQAGSPGMDVPVSLALLLAYGASVYCVLIGSGTTYFESISMFVFFLLCARVIAIGVRHRSTSEQLALATLLPDIAMRVRDGEVTCVSRRQIRIGDRLRVRTGDRVAADGTVVSGSAPFDEALLTGESLPVHRGPGDTVLAGSHNLGVTVEMEVTAVQQATRVGQMASVLGGARERRPARATITDRVARYFVIALLSLAALIAAVWWQVNPDRAFEIALAVLVVTCPCALSLAVPTALTAATARASRRGLLVSHADALETLRKVTHVVFDKTGTLSEGRPEITEIRPDTHHPKPVSAAELTSIVSALEVHSSHPLALAFTDIEPAGEAMDVRTETGRGLAGTLGGRKVRVGSARFVGTSRNAGAQIHVADDDGYLGGIVVEDTWRAGTRDVIRELKAQNIRTIILSGDDSARVADAVAQLGMDEGHGALLPEDKLSAIQNLQASGACVLAVGDGVNDASLLAGADVSVAMASGADLAQAGADIVLARTDLSALSGLFELGHSAHRVVLQNLAWAIGYNVVAVPLAALGLIGPALAALGMSLSSLVVVINAARIDRKPQTQPALRIGDATA